MAAAQWCAEIHQANPEAKIGVVVPDLSTHYDRVLRQFAATLSPERDSRDPIFDLSGGKSLVGPAGLAARKSPVELDQTARRSGDTVAIAQLSLCFSAMV